MGEDAFVLHLDVGFCLVYMPCNASSEVCTKLNDHNSLHTRAMSTVIIDRDFNMLASPTPTCVFSVAAIGLMFR